MQFHAELTLRTTRRLWMAALLLLPVAGAVRAAEPATGALESATFACTQAPTGPVRKLTGTGSDSSGASIVGVSLTLRCGDFARTATTDATGSYTLLAPAGHYLLTAEAANFEPLHRSVLIADAASGSEVNPVLRPQQAHSSVTVSAGNAYLTTVDSASTKTDLPLEETPQAISVVNREMMDAENVVKLDDALRNVSGVIPGGYYDGWDYYRIRGFDASFNTYIDGLRGGNGVAEETWGLESVEVLKGPSSALYGQSTLGGLVNIVTRKPVPANFAHIQFTEGSYNFTDPAIDAGHIFNSSHTVYGRLAALFHSGDTFVDYTHRNRIYLAPSLTIAPSANNSLTLIGRIQRDNGRQGMPLPAAGTVIANPNGAIPINRYIGELEANANKMQQANQQFGYQFLHKWNDHLALHQNARFAWYQQDWNRIYYPSYLGDDQRTLYRYPLNWHGPWQAHEVDTNLEAHHSFWNMEHTALLGVDFYRSPSSSTGYIGGNEPLDLYAPVYGANPIESLTMYTNSKTVTQYTGIYLQDHARLPHNITVTAGGRMDIAKNESKGSANQNGIGLTPRVGLTWLALPSTTLYASFSKSYLPQSGLVWTQDGNGSYLPPERGVQWEGGAKSSFLNGHLTSTLALFQLNRNNVATSDPDTAHANYYVVTGEQRSRGIEFEAALHPLTGWNIAAAYSYTNAIVLQDSSIAAGTPTLNAPRNILNFWTSYEIPRGTLHGMALGFGGRHYTDQTGDQQNSFQLPGYGLADASLSYTRGHAKLQFNANNVTNARYFSGSYNNLYVKPGEPRTVRGTIAWNF